MVRKCLMLSGLLIAGCVHQPKEPLVQPQPVSPPPIVIEPKKAPAPSHELPKIEVPKVSGKLSEKFTKKKPSEVQGIEMERTRVFPRY